MESTVGASPPLPVADALSVPFWAAVSRKQLSIQRCLQCRKYFFPPVPFCHECSSTRLAYEPVSGLATVHSYTEVVSGARHGHFAARVPYLVGIVELSEQTGLLMYTNFVGAKLADLSVDAKVTVEFETLSPGCLIPQFRLIEI